MENVEKYPYSGLSKAKLEKIFEEPGLLQYYGKQPSPTVLKWRRHRPFLIFMIALSGALWFSFVFSPTTRLEKISGHSIEAPSETREPASAMVIVEEGDTLYSIAQRAYGRSARYEFLYQVNRDTLKSPRSLANGQKIQIP